MASLSPDAAGPSVAILPWGDVIEDFLSPLGLDARTYLEKTDGGWLFGYVAALQKTGWRPILLWGSSEVAKPERIVHPATGAAIWLFPARPIPCGGPAAWTSLRRWLVAPTSSWERLIAGECCRAMIVQEYEDARFDRLVGLGARLGIPVYASFQGGDWTASWLESVVRARSIARSDGLIIPSAAETQRVRERYGSRLPPIAAVPNPVDVEQWRPIPREEARRVLGIAPETFLAINHGRIDIRRKGLDVLAEAWALLEPGKGDRLVVIGSGQDDARFAELLQNQAAPGLEWHAGYDTDRERIRTWLSAADVYVTASRVEGMPVAPLEGMACGLPLLASDAKGLADILEGAEEHGGLLIPREDAGALAAGFQRLRADPALRARLGRAARRRVEAAFSIETVGAALSDFLLQPAGQQLRSRGVPEAPCLHPFLNLPGHEAKP
ncbi:MAG TPA: glycosyltransferase family 4 protein [Novosphingobium sp.]|nr:glycosyltransferase family 4 protein [Novosphingobium sp.]